MISSITLQNVRNTLMKFSEDGTIFGYYEQENQLIRIVKVWKGSAGIEKLLDQIEMKKFICTYDGDGDQDLGFIKHIEFDLNNRFFIGWGDQ